MTQKEFLKVAKRFAKQKTLERLRKEQRIISSQLRQLYNWNTKKFTGTEDQFYKLQCMGDLRTQAIDIQSFPNEERIDYYEPCYESVVF
jgi:hypothetical protein